MNKKTYKAALIAFLADNLASHTIGGFKQSMSFTKCFCCSCMATKDEACHYSTAQQFILRTPQQHDVMCEEVKSDTSRTQEKSTEYGINETSVLNNVTSLSVIGSLCHNIMHDLLEGAIPYELKFLLQYAFDAKYLTLSQ